VIPVLEQMSQKRAGRDFGVCVMPEFIREGSALADYREPLKLTIGTDEERTAAIVQELYRHLPGTVAITSIEVAELVKYVENAWHALKVGFANEVGTLCKWLTVDSHELMRLFLMDTRLNVSPSYLKPGFAFGGSCLPKDLRALNHAGRMLSLELPILNAVLPSNGHHIMRALQLVESLERRKVGVLGISYKPGTDDLRESPVVELVERLIGKGYDVSLYDPNVNLSTLIGANRQQLLQRIPHIAKLLVADLNEVVEKSEIVIISTREPEFDGVLSRLRSDQAVLDLVRVPGERQTQARYVGMCW
jgi:GDP-mannose 6-dehydrogenase